MLLRRMLKIVKPDGPNISHDLAIIMIMGDQIPAYFLATTFSYITLIKSSNNPHSTLAYWPEVVRNYRAYNHLKK